MFVRGSVILPSYVAQPSVAASHSAQPSPGGLFGASSRKSGFRVIQSDALLYPQQSNYMISKCECECVCVCIPGRLCAVIIIIMFFLVFPDSRSRLQDSCHSTGQACSVTPLRPTGYHEGMCLFVSRPCCVSACIGGLIVGWFTSLMQT